jgi:uncharacterized protein YaeQ
MALKATIYKAELQISDMDRQYYGQHALTIARHPSENDERMMVRLLAFALHASDTLAFGKGLSSDDEPDLWQKDLTGAVALWVELGQPEERLIRRACGRADGVYVYSYSGNSADIWWSQSGSKLASLDNLAVVNLPAGAAAALAGLAQRSMQLNCMIQDGQVWVADQKQSVQVDLQVRKAASPARGG